MSLLSFAAVLRFGVVVLLVAALEKVRGSLGHGGGTLGCRKGEGKGGGAHPEGRLVARHGNAETAEEERRDCRGGWEGEGGDQENALVSLELKVRRARNFGGSGSGAQLAIC